jgi:GTP-binding protein
MDNKELIRRFRAARFRLSTPTMNQLPPDVGFEVAFAGRSNAGKSSALNTITDQTGLARVSKTPGRTQQLVVFDLDEQHRLVDLPGYGYAKVPKLMKETWGQVVEEYLLQRQCLRGVVLMTDIRQPMKPLDQVFLDFAASRQLPCLVLVTKADKLNRGPGLVVQRHIERSLKDFPAAARVQLFSSPAGTGLEEARWLIAEWLEWATPRPLPSPRIAPAP